VCGGAGIGRWCMVYPRRWSGMSVWWGRYMEVVYGVPKEVEWYECVVGRYMEVVYGVPKEVVWYSVWWGRYRELVYSVPKERGGMV